MSRRVGLTREAVLEHARAIVDEGGPDALTLTALAGACGVRKPSLYKHVDGLPDVEASLVAWQYAALAAAVREITAHAHGRDAVLLLAEAWRGRALAHPGLYALGTRTHLDLPEGARSAGERLLADVFAVLRSAGVPEHDVVAAARALRSLVHGWCTLEVSRGFGLSTSTEASFRRSVEALVDGFLPPRPGV